MLVVFVAYQEVNLRIAGIREMLLQVRQQMFMLEDWWVVVNLVQICFVVM